MQEIPFNYHVTSFSFCFYFSSTPVRIDRVYLKSREVSSQVLRLRPFPLLKGLFTLSVTVNVATTL